jgi:hypothetical protein
MSFRQWAISQPVAGVLNVSPIGQRDDCKTGKTGWIKTLPTGFSLTKKEKIAVNMVRKHLNKSFFSSISDILGMKSIMKRRSSSMYDR